MEKIKVTLQAISDGDGRDSSSFKDRRTFEVELSREQVSKILTECEGLFGSTTKKYDIMNG